MKKLIISAIAAAAFLFGFASCSGDLHDVSLIDLSNYAVIGSLNGFSNTANPLTKNADGTYSATWTAVCGGQTSKGGEGETFAIIEQGDNSWGTAYRLAQPKATGDAANVFSSANNEQKVYQGQSADCMLIPNDMVSKGDTVKLTITPDATFISVKVSVEKSDTPAPAAPVPFHLDGFFVSSSMNGGAATLTEALYNPTLDESSGILTYHYDFKFDAASNKSWGQKVASEVSFGIRNATSDWKVKYTGGSFSLGTDSDYVETKLNADNNNLVSGLSDGKSYRIYIQTTPEKKVSYKAVLLNTVELGVVVTDLPEILNGKVFYIRGGMNGWNADEGYKGTVSNGSLSINWNYTYEGESFDPLEYEFKFSVKPGSSDDRKKADGWGLQLAGEGGKNLSMELSGSEPKVNFNASGDTNTTDNGTCTYYVISAE